MQSIYFIKHIAFYPTLQINNLNAPIYARCNNHHFNNLQRLLSVIDVMDTKLRDGFERMQQVT